MFLTKDRSIFLIVLSICIMYQSTVLKAEEAMEAQPQANRLIHETSPYLLLHATNPVDWYPWGEEALKMAGKENKLIVISIGYSACHWCHVMERESFQDSSVAEIMNRDFVSIKIDREERPDLDQLYMHAAHLLTGKGGWPLHVIALPDGRPIYAGTYYTKEKWISFLYKINTFYKENPEKAEEMAEAVTEGIRKLDVLELDKETTDFSVNDLDVIYEKWSQQLDELWGGRRGAPKFPMPVGIQFLLRYYFITQKPDVLDAIRTNLDRMALGGIYDQIGGGFARYSVDALWKVPHFEKMLYDNAQMISLYTAAYQLTKDPLYKHVVFQTIEFVNRELTSPEGGFYASLDADSDGEEGKYYVWTQDEIEETLGKQAPLILDYYHIHKDGNWKDGENVLYRRYRDVLFAKKHDMPIQRLEKDVKKAQEKLLEIRKKRVRPAVDIKILTSWNALMLKALLDAYRVFDENEFMNLALKHVNFLKEKVVLPDGQIRRSYSDDRSIINGFLDDYALMIQAYLGFYQATFDEDWLFQADTLTGYVLKHFYNQDDQLFYYTSDLDTELIARKMEIPDHVMPSSNSVMGNNLFLLGKMMDRTDYLDCSKNMLLRVKSRLAGGGPYYGNWSQLLINFVSPPYEVVILGKKADQKRQEIDAHYLPNVILMGSKKESQLPLLQDRFVDDLTMIYVCRDKTCQLPVETVKEALQQIK